MDTEATDLDTAAEEVAEPAPEPEEDDSAEEVVEAEASSAPERPRRSLQDSLKHLTPDLAAPVKQLQAEFTRRSQKLAALEKEQAAALERASAAEAKLQKALAALEALGDGEVDVLSEGADAKVAALVGQLRDVKAEAAAAEKARQQEVEAAAAIAKYDAFVVQHPELETDKGLRSEIRKLLQANAALDFETAFWAAKGRRPAAEFPPPKPADPKKAARRKAEQEAASVVAAARPGRPPPKPTRQDLRKMSNEEILALARQQAGS